MSETSHATPPDAMGELTDNRGRTFYVIADDLVTWFNSLDMCETDEDRAQVQTCIDRLGKELATKAENIAGVLRRIKAECELIASEEMRLTARRIAFEKSADWLTRYTMSVMRDKGLPYLKSPTVTLKIQGNGGVQPLVIDGEVPAELMDVTVRMPAPILKAMVGNFPAMATSIK